MEIINHGRWSVRPLRGLFEPDRPQVLEQNDSGGGIIFHQLGDHLDIFHLDDAADFEFQRVKDSHCLGIQLLQLELPVWSIFILRDDDRSITRIILFRTG